MADRLLCGVSVCALALQGIALVPTARAAETALESSADAALDAVLGRSEAAPVATPSRITDPAAPGGRRVLETAFTLPRYRGSLAVPLPPPSPQPAWRARTDVDWQVSQRLSGDWSWTVGDRFNVQHAEGQDWTRATLFRNDLRELHVTHAGRNHLTDIGRVNARGGVAAGYNPTDYFRARAVVERVSQDPSVLRENRLGTVMWRTQWLSDRGAITAVFAPRLGDAPPVDLQGETGFQPQWSRTNAANQWLVRGNYRLAEDVDPEFSIYRGGDRTLAGIGVTRALSSRLTGYVEWSGGRQLDLFDRAHAAGVQEGRFPPNAAPAMPISGKKKFLNDLAVGTSFPISGNVDAVIEYDFHQGGFSRSDWDRWFDAGGARGGPSPAAGQLGQLQYIRMYAVDQQEPINRHNLFTRLEWRNFLVRNVTMTHLNILNLTDKSFLHQITVRWDVSDTVSLSTIVNTSVGSRLSENGSSANRSSLLLNGVFYF